MGIIWLLYFLFATLYYSNRMKILRVCKRTQRSYDQWIPESFGTRLFLVWIIKVHQRWAVRRPHRSSTKKIMLMTIEPTMHRVYSLLNTWCLFGVHRSAAHHPPLKYRCPIKASNWIRPIYLTMIFSSLHVTSGDQSQKFQDKDSLSETDDEVPIQFRFWLLPCDHFGLSIWL